MTQETKIPASLEEAEALIKEVEARLSDGSVREALRRASEFRDTGANEIRNARRIDISRLKRAINV